MKLLYYLSTLFKCTKNILTTWKYLDMNDFMNETDKHSGNKPLWSITFKSSKNNRRHDPNWFVRIMDVMISTLENLKLIDDWIPGGFCKNTFWIWQGEKKLVFWFNQLRELDMLGKISVLGWATYPLPNTKITTAICPLSDTVLFHGHCQSTQTSSY